MPCDTVVDPVGVANYSTGYRTMCSKILSIKKKLRAMRIAPVLLKRLAQGCKNALIRDHDA